jgi:hypothetical protein
MEAATAVATHIEETTEYEDEIDDDPPYINLGENMDAGE